MGNTISSIINQQQNDAKAQAEDALNSLEALANSKLDLWYNVVSSGGTDQKLLPIDAITLRNRFVYCQTTDNPLDIATIINQVGSQFASGDVVNGIATIIQNSLGALVPSSQASVAEDQFYVISVGDLGGISRIDIMTFCYSFTSQALTNITQHCQGACCVMSSVQSKALDKQTVIDIVQQCYAGCSVDVQQNILAQVEKALDMSTSSK